MLININQSRLLRLLPCGTATCRAIATSCAVSGRRSREPYDKRWGIHPKDIRKHGGTTEMAKQLAQGVGMPQMPGYRNKKGIFIHVPELIPEFVVPDLTDFKLKPYVSYRVREVNQSEFTAKDLFDATYAKQIVDDVKSGKISEDKVKDEVEKIKLKANS